MNAIFTRRSVRNFSDKKVEQEKVEQLLKAGMQAPSAGNQQPWEFIVVRGRENLLSLSKYNPHAGCLKNADIAIIVMGNCERMAMPELWEQDLGAVTQNIQLQAVELGLGSVWIGTAPDAYKMDFIRDLYGLGKKIMPYSVVAVGYPQNENANHFIDRYDPSRVNYIG